MDRTFSFSRVSYRGSRGVLKKALMVHDALIPAVTESEVKIDIHQYFAVILASVL
jgi:hypothetical protein